MLGAKPFPGLGDGAQDREDAVRNFVLAVYCLKHLRGNAVLDVEHDNDACTEEEYALALMQRRISLQGVFLRVA